MNWQLAHRPRGVCEFTEVTLAAPSSWAAVEQLRETIPERERELVLYVRAVD